MIELRAAEPEDLPGISALERQVMPLPWTEQMLAAENRRQGHRGIVAIFANSIVGYSFAFMLAGELHILTLAVDRAHQRKGIARRVLSKLLVDATNEGCELATLEVRESNDAARMLYSGLGFVESYRRRRYYRDTGEDALVLELRLKRSTA